ncbi:MAG: hypothetical protein EHM49_00780 [Deltaproteobacteria bacterium]|nr:MAG: hypothetical protein EHM49_00780 [Deltaproteobacteria bacterium]
MKVSRLISELRQQLDVYGDLEVGIEDSEFGCYDPVGEIGLREAVKTNGVSSDSDELGKCFIFVR